MLNNGDKYEKMVADGASLREILEAAHTDGITEEQAEAALQSAMVSYLHRAGLPRFDIYASQGTFDTAMSAALDVLGEVEALMLKEHPELEEASSAGSKSGAA